MSGTVGTLGAFDDSLFGVRFQIREDAVPPAHATRCAAHSWYRGPHCPKCCLAVEEAALVAQRGRVLRKLRRESIRHCRGCGERVPKDRRLYCTKACYREANGEQNRNRVRRCR